MKKIIQKKYEKPQIKVFPCALSDILCQSAINGAPNDSEDNWVNEDEALSKPNHDVWGNIW